MPLGMVLKGEVGGTDKEGGGLCNELFSKFLNGRKFFGNECTFSFKLKILNKDFYLFIYF